MLGTSAVAAVAGSIAGIVLGSGGWTLAIGFAIVAVAAEAGRDPTAVLAMARDGLPSAGQRVPAAIQQVASLGVLVVMVSSLVVTAATGEMALTYTA